ncbi:MAG: hypothetical protein KF878_35330 [Planctomycetes bacterium]|nr:hypothetical protein [Planctomycetota bacterium]
MADARLLEAWRRWRQAGTVLSEAAYLLERVRAGELAAERVAFAAAFGRPSARLTGITPVLLGWPRFLSRRPGVVGRAVALLTAHERVVFACDAAEPRPRPLGGVRAA